MIKDSGSLHSALVVKPEICEKDRFLNKTYLLNDQNSIFHPFKCNIVFWTTHALNIYKKRYPVFWRLVLSTKSHAHLQLMPNVAVAGFRIPQTSSEWCYGILMTSVALPDDLYLTDKYVNK